MSPATKLIGIFCCVAPLCSCNIFKHHEKTTYSERSLELKQALEVANSYDLHETVTTNDTETKQIESNDSENEITVEFSSTGSTGDAPIEINRHDGGWLIHGGNGQIKNIKVREAEQQQKQSMQNVTTTQTVKDSTAYSDSVLNAQTDMYEINSSKSVNIPWLGIIVLGLILFGLLYSIKKFFEK